MDGSRDTARDGAPPGRGEGIVPSRAAVAAGVAGPLLFVAMATVTAAGRPGYDAVSQFVSELAEPGARGAASMRIVGFVVSGLLIACWGHGLARATAADRYTRRAGGVLRLFGCCMALAGVFPCDPGGRIVASTARGWMHMVVSLPAFGLAWTAPLSLGASPALRRAQPWLARLSAAAGVAMLVSLVALTPQALVHGPWCGLLQRVYLAGALAWAAAVAVLLRFEARTVSSGPSSPGREVRGTKA